MKFHTPHLKSRMHRQALALLLACSISFVQPGMAFAQAVDSTGNETGAPADTGAPECTGAGCGQGANQGADQGTNQGGSSASDLGADENGNLPAGTADNRQGANQGAAAGSSNGVAATNSNTGANSNNQTGVNANNSATTGINNNVTDITNANANGSTGGNASSANTGNAGITTGSAGIGVTQVKNDNTATIGGTAGLNVTGHQGDYFGDLNLDFGASTANLSGGSGSSVRAINDTTGAHSDNGIDVQTRTEEINEVQNDGRIDNILDLAAITGQNAADKNTGNASIKTGDANVAATLVNLLNTTVINGDLWITVADIFGDLNGNINIPDFSQWIASYAASQGLVVDAENSHTGENSDNTIEVEARDTETTRVNNDADITTTFNANAITGQNTAEANTGGSEIATGNAQVTGSNVSVANTTVEGGNWGLFIVNALNGWLGFLVGDGGQVRALSQDETLRQIEAQNNNTGSDSDNTIHIEDEHERTTTVDNDAVINNEITASAITGQNETNKNTGKGQIETGDANVQATTVNIANTTVKDGSLFIAVVNIFGDWLGDLLYGGKSLASAAAANNPATTVEVNAENSNTGSDSDNTIEIDYDKEHTTTIDNKAKLTTTLNANVDTGNNKANKNTMGATIETGDGLMALHSRSAANLVGIAGNTGVGVNINGLNDTTGADSTNRIRADINSDRIISINNEANVDTIIGSLRLPSLINTGNNEANQNTLGASIVTGDIDAEIAIQNLVNKVILALAGGGVTVDADFANRLTGALSTNSNDLTVDQRTLIDILNKGLVNNLINLLLNTGGNTANENTGGGSVVTGDICVDIALNNNVNSVRTDVGGDINATTIAANNQTGWESDNSNSVGADHDLDLNIDNDGKVNNNAKVDATTGNNEANRNTSRNSVGKNDGCEKLAQAPSPTPAPGGQGGPGEEDKGGQGGGEEAQAEEKNPQVAGAKEKAPNGGGLLKRFPVAGGEDLAQILQGKKRIPWQLFLVVSLGLLGLAWRFDRRVALQPTA